MTRPLSRILTLCLVAAITVAAALAGYLVARPGSDVHSQGTEPYSYFEGLSETDLQDVQVKLSFVGITNKPVLTAGILVQDGELSIAKFVPFEQADVDYPGDDSLVETCTVTTAEMHSLIAAAGALSDVASGVQDPQHVLSYMLLDPDAGGDRAYEALPGSASAGEVLDAILGGLDAGDADCQALVRQFSSAINTGVGIFSGDTNCSGLVNPVDALTILRVVVGLEDVDRCIAVGGDVDCNLTLTSVDALDVLRFVAQLSLNLPGGCPQPGETVPR